jgi:hypothetical protein
LLLPSCPGRSAKRVFALDVPGIHAFVDAMDNADEAEHYIEGGLRRLGLDPAEIR